MLFIFDWDGTLCDSTQKIVNCMQGAASDAGLNAPADHEVMEIIGLGLPEAILQLFPSLEPARVDHVREAYAHHFVHVDTTPASLFPGAEELLVGIRESGHQVAIATGKSRIGLNRVLSDLDVTHYFDGSRCADETASKPDPKMLRELLIEFDTPVTQAVMIGDTEFDMEMARRIGMDRIAVDYGAHHVNRLKGFQPKMCLSALDELHELL